jgi:hypothetical protein
MFHLCSISNIVNSNLVVDAFNAKSFVDYSTFHVTNSKQPVVKSRACDISSLFRNDGHLLYSFNTFTSPLSSAAARKPLGLIAICIKK